MENQGLWVRNVSITSLHRPREGQCVELLPVLLRFVSASWGPFEPRVAAGQAWRRIQGWDRQSTCVQAKGKASRSCS